ncbi:histidine kinase [Dactylosporangium sp. NPDC049140]|uniref:sensor histidine kinase n=1 Tax=Dactylosporangium sp. NPDC049140 TaxID=3155647 RepID=UPI0033FE9BBD
MTRPAYLEDPMTETDWRPWLPEAITAIVVLAFGLTEALVTWAVTGGNLVGFAQAVTVAFAVALCRRAPEAALGLVWGLGLLHVLFGAPLMLIEFALTAVFYGGARWGRPPTVVMSALSVPLAVVVAFVLHDGNTVSLHLLLGGSRLGVLIREESTLRLAMALIGLLVVAAPWPAGLLVRSLERASTSRTAMLAAEEVAAGARRETEHAHEIAHLRDQQTRLARDVHDVVGHSLAVILAQAESGQYLDDTERLKKVLQTIATSARSSLRDVRQVLSSTQDTGRGDADRFEGLIAGVRSGGHEIVVTELGAPRQLLPDAAEVAYRVLQEMLTNAIKHGRRDRPITVERGWPPGGGAGVLRIEVTNTTEPADPAGTANAGRGLDGMRRRLEAIGGRLDVRRPESATFTAAAFVPVRGGAG